MKPFFLAIVILTFFSCRNANKNADMDIYFDKEINNRITLLEQLSTEKDTLQINAEEINKQVNKFILLSKDIENLSASANLANTYFEELSLKYGMKSTDFIRINTGMHVNDIASTLKQNELNLLNQLVFKYNSSQIKLFTAQ